MVQHPFLNQSNFTLDQYPYVNLNNVVSSEVASTTPDGKPAVYKVTYSDGTTRYELPTSVDAGGGYGWRPYGEGLSANTMPVHIADTGGVGEETINMLSSDPSKINWQKEKYDNALFDANALKGILAVAAMAGGMGSLSNLFGAAAPGVEAGAMSVPGAFGPMSSTAALQSSSPLWLDGALAGGAVGGGMDLFSGLGDTTADLGMDPTLEGLLDGYAGGGGTTTEWLTDAIAEGNYSLADLARTIGMTPSDVTKFLSSGGTESDLIKMATQMVGQNMANNSVTDILNDYADRIEGSSPFTPQQRQELGDIAMSRFGTDYLNPSSIDYLTNEYRNRGGAADKLSAGLEQLYADPTQMSVYNAINDLATENLLRTQGARGTSQAGNVGSDLFKSNVASMLQLANPMNQSLSTMFQGQQVPIQAWNALSNAQTQAAQQGGAAAQAGSGTQQALGNYFTQFAAPVAVGMDPTRANVAMTGAQAGSGSSGGPNIWGAIANKGLDKLFTTMGW